MQVVATVVGRKQMIRLMWITDYGIEIDQCIKMSWRSNPIVDGLPVSLV
jgi:ribosome maturation factor RimP